MNEDSLAAVVAAANLLLARARTQPAATPAPAAQVWGLAGRVRPADAGHARLLAGARSRWAMRGLLRD